jgi:hypothetical protein
MCRTLQARSTPSTSKHVSTGKVFAILARLELSARQTVHNVTKRKPHPRSLPVGRKNGLSACERFAHQGSNLGPAD